MSATPKRPAVFLDRDGTVMEECSYPSHPSQVRLIPGAAAAIERLRRAGFACVIVTNQSGVGRGMLTLEQMHSVNRELERQLKAAGTQYDGLYFCTIAPQAKDKTVIEHPERKPGPGMLFRAARELELDLQASWIVGDSISDVLAGRNAGSRGEILVRTGHDLAETLELLGSAALVVDDLSAAADHIVSRTR